MSKSNSSNSDLISRSRAALLGLVVGDVLGAPVQFGANSAAIRDRLSIVKNFHDNHVLPRGVYTDDTSMALCIADSLIECHGYDSYDIMKKYCDWEAHGYRSYFDYGYDVGGQVDRAICDYAKGPVVKKSQERSWNAGNGSLMRLVPTIIAAAPRASLAQSVELAWISGRETHYSLVAEMGTEVFANFLYSALHFSDQPEHSPGKSNSPSRRQSASGSNQPISGRSLSQSKQQVVSFDNLYFTSKELEETWLDNSWLVTPRVNSDGECLRDLGGFVMDAITIALWGFIHSDNFEDGLLKVLCLGGDTDTNCAIYGQLAGAFYGLDSIPSRLADNLALSKESIFELSDQLVGLSSCPILRTRFEEDSKYFQRPTSAF